MHYAVITGGEPFGVGHSIQRRHCNNSLGMRLEHERRDRGVDNVGCGEKAVSRRDLLNVPRHQGLTTKTTMDRTGVKTVQAQR
jgi:hypothetical protein